VSLQAVIFDLDGTLVDSLGDIASAMNDTLAAFELPTHPVPSYRMLVGEGVANLVKRAVPEDRPELCDDVLAAFRVRYGEHLVDRTRPFHGVPDLLRGLLGRKLRLAVVSNKPDPATHRIIDQLFPRTFSLVRGERAGMPRKPDPRAALEAAVELGARPETTAFVGDSAIDMRTAGNAGMLAVGVTWGYRDEAELRGGGASLLTHHPAELLELLVRHG